MLKENHNNKKINVCQLHNRIAMRNTIAYPTQPSSSHSRGILCSHKPGNDDRVSQRYNCFTRNGGNVIPKHAGPEAKGNNPTAGLTLLWARNPFRGNFNHWEVSRKEAGQIFSIYILNIFLVEMRRTTVQ